MLFERTWIALDQNLQKTTIVWYRADAHHSSRTFSGAELAGVVARPSCHSVQAWGEWRVAGTYLMAGFILYRAPSNLQSFVNLQRNRPDKWMLVTENFSFLKLFHFEVNSFSLQLSAHRKSTFLEGWEKKNHLLFWVMDFIKLKMRKLFRSSKFRTKVRFGLN